jgi:NADH-quinone oxidoreductase subunit C
MLACEELLARLRRCLADALLRADLACGEVTIEVAPERLVESCVKLRDDDALHFEQLMDLCGVDYASYGEDEWSTEQASGSGFSRGVAECEAGRRGITTEAQADNTGRRFAVVCHLLSIRHNARLRVKCFAADDHFPVVPTLTGVWASADWFEREAFDLFGILFEDHPDLRRLLTDYGFIGHPFRKDFPLSGNVEVRYDPDRKRVVYEPVSIEPRVLVPRVVRARKPADA